MKRIFLAALVAAMILAFFALDYHQFLTFEALQRHQNQFSRWLALHPVAIPVGFFAFYVLVTALSLPGATVMTLAAGAAFGFWQGLLLVSFASSLGATLAFLLARFLFREPVRQRFGERLKTLNAGIERDGPFYLFTLRLIPLFPFFVINLAMALTPLRTWTFYWVSQVGMLAGTAVYVNAGTQVAAVDQASDIMSFPLLLSFAALGLFPWIARALIRLIQRRRVYRNWRRPKRFDRNLIVIGAGAGGLVSAYIAATVKAKVTLVEAHKMGGDCLNYGCVPSKALIKSAQVAYQMRHADRYGLAPQTPRLRFADVMARIQGIIRDIEPHDSAERYRRLGAEVVKGYATLVDPWTVKIAPNKGSDYPLTSRAIVIAAGSEPKVPAIPGMDSVGYVTTDTLWDRFAELEQPPARLLVLGGGPIGCELSQALARLGSQVSLIEAGERLLTKEDPEVAELAQQALATDGVRVLTGHRALRCEREGDGKILIAQHGTEEKRLGFDQLLVAVGREPRLRGYGLENLGIPTHEQALTNEYLETIYPNILAAGDLASPYQYTHAAAHTAWYATVNALFGQFKRFKADYSLIPRTTFLDPEIAHVGLTEQEARRQGRTVDVTRFELAELDRAIVDSSTQGFVKVLTPPGRDRILGATIVGTDAGNLLAEFVLAMKHGLGLNKLLGTIHTYPTLAEANKYTAGAWKKKQTPQRLLQWLSRYHGWRR